MKPNIWKYRISPNDLLTLIFGAVVFVFFGYYYPYHLNYQEQFQLFLYTPAYFFDFMSRPGGLADYLGSFFTQFYFYSKIGAVILALLLSVLQRLVWSASLKLGAAVHWMPFTFIPSILYWNLLCDENYLLGGLKAMFLLALFINIYLLFKPGKWQIIGGILLLAALYWFAGGVFIFFAFFVIGAKIFEKNRNEKQALIAVISTAAITLALPYIAKALVLQYPMEKLWVGTTFFRYPVNIPVSTGVIGLLIFALPFLLLLLSQFVSWKRTLFIFLSQVVIFSLLGFSFIRNSADFSKEEVMEYDFHIRMRKWDRAIALADKKAPNSPLSVTCLNLALAKQDLLGERMFSYYQNGMGGLIPDFTRDFTIPTIAGEVYYHLGLVNTAQRFAFEAMEALPNYQKSVRSVKRLAETNIINGNYEVAKKYLYLLQKTFYYRAWATQALEIIKDEKRVEQHVEWGWLREARIKDDFLFSEQEKENMLGLLFSSNQNNRMALEYLLASNLLKKDLQHFITFFPLTQSLNYKVIPTHFQEALLYIWEATNNDPTKHISYPISNTVRARFVSFKKSYAQTGNASLLQKDFGDTYWYYLNVRTQKK